MKAAETEKNVNAFMIELDALLEAEATVFLDTRSLSTENGLLDFFTPGEDLSFTKFLESGDQKLFKTSADTKPALAGTGSVIPRGSVWNLEVLKTSYHSRLA